MTVTELPHPHELVTPDTVGAVPVDADGDAGFTTAEYAVGTVAACGFAGVLYKLLTSEAVTELLADVIRKAFDFLL
jgi:hypothetical protein